MKEAYSKSDNAASIHGKIQRRLPSFDTLSDRNVQLVQDWLRDCVEHHDKCRLNRPFQWPTRLIDVGVGDGSSIPRLVVTMPSNQPEPYVALSHTWGQTSTSARFLITEVQSFEERVRGIPMQSLPQNFQDAIVVTQRWGIRYLWIDSLCIIQDSPSDWATEASRMHLVYAHAHLTIAAMSAASAHDGFLKRQQIPYAPVRVPYCLPDNAESHGFFYLVLREGHYALNEFDQDVEGSVWNTRGWTLQERILSRRVVHFTKGLLFFECRCCERAEDNRPLPATSFRTPWIDSVYTPGQDWQFSSRAGTELSYEIWYKIVQRYSMRNLTRGDDKLPALSGVAHEIAPLLKDQYLAGLWKDNLGYGLSWELRDSTQLTTFYRAPSWSWARYDGDVFFDLHGTINAHSKSIACFELLEATVEPAGADPMGAVASGWLKLRGMNHEISRIVGPETTSGDAHEIYRGNVRLGSGRLDLVDRSMTGPGLVAFLLRWVLYRTDRPGIYYPCCLLLQETGKNPYQYHRVGIMSMGDFSKELVESVGFDGYEEAEITII